MSYNFDSIKVSPEWCFKNVRSVERWTHGYHRYPAKFLPNLVEKLINEETKEGDVIADLFAGCGTTLVEAKIQGRKSIGVDINPVANLITKVKINPIIHTRLTKQFDNFIKIIENYKESDFYNRNFHERIDYWFEQENKNKIAFLYEKILEEKNLKIRNFFLVSLSHILKNCSRWLQSSTKPQIDPNKKIQDPFKNFEKHTRQMLRKNKEFYEKLKNEKNLETECKIKKGDARNTKIEENSINAIITSPPYVTSYEYADIHQLTGYWYEYISNLPKFRKKFIGTFYSLNKSANCNSTMAQKTVDKLLEKDDRTAREVANYFNDMKSVAEEMYRIVKKKGIVCVVIGNTIFKEVKIKAAEIFFDMLKSTGFKEEKIIKRSIPYKLMPTIRDKNSGRFTKLNNKNHKLVYPEEYILILRK